MKIHFDNVNLNSTSGPNTAAHRLAKQFFELGHEVHFVDGQNCDVSLVFIEPTGQKLAPKVIQRLDGIWFKPQEFMTKNVGIKRLYDTADGVIFQSEFDRKMITKWWKEPRAGSVIQNGIDIDIVKELNIPALQQLCSTYPVRYVCSANWHPQKRLRDTVELFKKFRQRDNNCCLIVLGANPDYVVANPHVFYAGSVPRETYMQIYSAASWMMHLAWADHCPNVVIEALSQGTPVLCTDVGGTQELIGEYGYVIKEPTPYNFELADYDNPPSLEGIDVPVLKDRLELDYTTVPNFDIVSVAQRYVGFFNSIR